MPGLEDKLVNIAMLAQPGRAVGVSCPLLGPRVQPGCAGVSAAFAAERRGTAGDDEAVGLTSAGSVFVQPGDGIVRKINPAFTPFLGDRRQDRNVMFLGSQIDITPDELLQLTIGSDASIKGQDKKW